MATKTTETKKAVHDYEHGVMRCVSCHQTLVMRKELPRYAPGRYETDEEAQGFYCDECDDEF